MKFSEEFKLTGKPQDIEPEVLAEFLKTIYGQDAVGLEFYNDQAGFAQYSRQANLATAKLQELSGESNFEQLTSHFSTKTSPGETRNALHLIKANAEVVCYQLHALKADHRDIPQSFRDEVKNSTLNACTPGVATYMENIANSFSPSIYHQKYNFIARVATEYMQANQVCDHPGNEVHMVNELIFAVKDEYKLQPPVDLYARYPEDIEANPGGEFTKHLQFRDHLRNLLSSRQGVYSYIEQQTQGILADLPDSSRFPGNASSEFTEGDVNYNLISDIAERMGRPIEDILQPQAAASKFKYKEGYKELTFIASPTKAVDRKETDIEKITRIAASRNIKSDAILVGDGSEYTYRKDYVSRIKIQVLEKGLD